MTVAMCLKYRGSRGAENMDGGGGEAWGAGGRAGGFVGGMGWGEQGPGRDGVGAMCGLQSNPFPIMISLDTACAKDTRGAGL